MRRGFSLAGVLVLLLVAGAVAGALAMMSRQAGRISHRFFQAEIAFDLAEAGVRGALELVAHARRADTVDRAPQAFRATLQALRAGAVTPRAEPLVLKLPAPPPGVEPLLAALAEWSPALDVTVRALDFKPLWSAPLHGLAADPRESRAVLQIVVSATITAENGRTVVRTLTYQTELRTLSVRPPLVGCFGLFAQSGAGPVNAVAPGFAPVELASADRVYLGGAAWKLDAGSLLLGEHTQVFGPATRVRAGGIEEPCTRDLPLDFGRRAAMWAGELAAGWFEGNLANGLQACADALSAKATYEVRGASPLAELSSAPGVLDVPGVVVIDGPLTIGAPLEIGGGGVIIARGPVRIAAGITRRPGAEPLTLVAASGDVTLATQASVDAYLVALAGKVALPPTSFHVRGGIAAARLDFTGLETGGTRRVIEHVAAVDPRRPDVPLELHVCGPVRALVETR